MQSIMQEECPNEEPHSKSKEAEIKEIKNNSDTKFSKLWSEEDEISLLSGYYEYQGKKGKSDVGGFYEFIKHRLIRSCVKQSQVSDKICRLKKKFMDHALKFEENPHEDVLDPHLEKLYELSRKIWCNVDDCNKNKIVGVKFDFSNNFLCEEFLDFLYHEGVDVDLLDSERLTNLKRKYGEVELSRSKFDYKLVKLKRKCENLKYDHYKRALDKFFH